MEAQNETPPLFATNIPRSLKNRPLSVPIRMACQNIFKIEAIHGERFLTRSAAKYQVFEYVEVSYNRKRLHSKLGYISPENFEAKKIA